MKLESQPHRDDLAKNLRLEKDKEKRQKILEKEKETPKYKKTREAVIRSRQEKISEDDKKRELAREKEKIEFVKEVQILKANFEEKIENTKYLIEQFFLGFFGDVSNAKSPELLELAKAKIKVLNSKTLSGSNYIINASQIILEMRKLKADVGLSIITHTKTKEQLYTHINEIQNNISVIKEKGILKRIASMVDVRKHNQQIKVLNKQVVAEERIIKKDNEDFKKISYEIYDFKNEICKLMCSEINDTLNEEIGQSLKKLWDKVNDSPFFFEAIGNKYIEKFVSPVFDKYIEEQNKRDAEGYYNNLPKIDLEVKERFLGVFKKYLVTKDHNTYESIKVMLSGFPSEFSNICGPFLEDIFSTKQTEEIISTLFTQYAMDKVAGGVELLNTERQKMDLIIKNKKEKDYFQDKVSKYYIKFPVNFSVLPYNVKTPISDGHFGREVLPNIPVWDATKETSLVDQTFSTTVEILDQKYLDKILKESLSDREGTFIDNLYYFPNPNSIKTLVLLAAADFENYRTVHANWVLDKLAQRSDWDKILNEAENKYPELKQVRSILESWDSSNFSQTSSEFEGLVDEFALSLLKNEGKNEVQSFLVKEVLSDDQLVKILESNKQISSEDASYLTELISLISNNEIKDYDFKSLVRECLLKSVKIAEFKEYEVIKKELNKELSTIISISKKIIKEKDNPDAFKFLSSFSVIQRIKSYINKTDSKSSDLDIDLFLESHRHIPGLGLYDSELIFKQFCEDFKGIETIEFYKKLYQLFDYIEGLNEHSEIISKIAKLVGEVKLSPERAIELMKIVKTNNGEVNFLEINNPELQSFALSYPEIALENNDGLDFLNHIYRKEIETLDSNLDVSIGRKYIDIARNKKIDPAGITLAIANLELRQKVKLKVDKKEISEINKNNWESLMLAFIAISQEHWRMRDLDDEGQQIKNVFENSSAKDMCMAEIKKLWLSYLEKSEINRIPFSLNMICDYIKHLDGAGPLSQIESLSTFIDSFREMLIKKETAPRTKLEIMEGMKSAEFRFKKERWSNENSTDFYNVSRDVISASPSLFSAYFNLFEKLKPNEFKEFSQKLFPLHRVLLSLSEKRDRNGNSSFNKRDLVIMRSYLENSIDKSGQFKSIDSQRKELMELILLKFRDKFGIIKVPENMTQENVRALTDISMYLANLSGRDEQKENILSFYLALSVNEKWDDYRQGKEINPEEFLTPEKSMKIKTYLEERSKLNPVTSENIGINNKEMPEFMKILQEESQNVVMGNVETIDVKLNNLISNMEGLKDLDLYPDLIDKKRMSLLLEYGNKKVGAVSSKIYQQLSKTNKQFEFIGDDLEIKKQIEFTLAEHGLEKTAENVKKYFQEEIKSLAFVVNIIQFIEEIGVSKEIFKLQDVLKPSEEVVAIFNKIGEEFKQTSGAIAISQDLEYLDNLIVKKDEELSEEEMKLVKTYITKVRDSLAHLEDVYQKIGKKFAGIRQGQSNTKNKLLKTKLEEISKIINMPQSQQVIESTITNNLNSIIENMRECLACVRQGSNNDTNLTFGDVNKFYLYSKSDIKAGSISDEIVFFEPVTFNDGSKKMAFILDRVYGMNTPGILINQIEVVCKKYKNIKKRFSDSKISIFISSSAIQTSGISKELLIERLKEKNGEKFDIQGVENIEVDVVKSVSGDHYVEFGGSARSDGKRLVSGVLIQ